MADAEKILGITASKLSKIMGVDTSNLASFIGLVVSSGYVPPQGDAVNFTFTGSYTPPSSGNADLF